MNINKKSMEKAINNTLNTIEQKVDSLSSLTTNIRWTERAINYFGKTTKPHEAGYILYNGEMLDFSGGHVDQRRLDHSEINFILTDEEIEKAKRKYRYEGTIQLFQTQSNAIRINSAQYGGYIHITMYDTQLITSEQLKTLEYILNYDVPKHITYDILNEDSRAVKYGEASSVSELKRKLYEYVQH